MSRIAFALAAICALGLVVGLPHFHAPSVQAASDDGPSYAPNGDMHPPTNYREWIYLSSGIDMSYSAKAMDMGSVFDNVFVNPSAYRSFLATGTWPDKTVLALENREARSKGSINQAGHFQGTDVTGFEVHVKDEKRFPGKWAFFSFKSPTSDGTLLLPKDVDCYSCHEAHGAVDTTFVQFYPTLLPIAQKKGTLSEAFVKEEAASVGK